MDIPLRAIPSNSWEKEYDELISDPYISKKYKRKKRLKDKVQYINQHFKEIKDAGGGSVLDIGPGPGEFLEICRHYGLSPYGIDAAPTESEMGYEYCRLSQLMTERQEIPVLYRSIDPMGIDYMGNNESYKFINCQGAIEQIFKDFLAGKPHKSHKNCNLLRWRVNSGTKGAIKSFIVEIKRVLEPGGICIIYGNGAQNVEEYNKMIISAIQQVPRLKLLTASDNRFHKIQKAKR